MRQEQLSERFSQSKITRLTENVKLFMILTFGSMSMTQIFPLFNTSFTDSTLVPYRLPLYSPYSRNLQNKTLHV